MNGTQKHVVIVGGGTAGSVLAARLSENKGFKVTLLELGPDDDAYDGAVLDPARAPEAWLGAPPVAMTPMTNGAGIIPMLQGRMLGGTSAVNGLATLRGLPEDYDGWAAAGLDGWGWQDVVATFKAAETDHDFPTSPLHGSTGPLPVRRWRRDEMGRAQIAFLDGMVEAGAPSVTDINDRSQLPGIGVFPVTIDQQGNRVTTSLAYLTAAVRARDNLTIRTGAEVTRLNVDGHTVTGVVLADGTELAADEVVVTAGALWTPNLLMRSGIGPARHLAEHGIAVCRDLPVGETLSDHIGPGLRYRHDGPRGGTAGPAQSLLIGASDGSNVDYHLFPIAPPPGAGPTEFVIAAFLLRSSGRGSVRLGDGPSEGPIVTVPPLPDDGLARLRDAFDRLAAWEQSPAAAVLGCTPVEPLDLRAADAPAVALERFTVSYGHMTSTCPMGSVLDANCRVAGMVGLRVADASAMPTIPSGNTYLGCVMIAERVASKMKAEPVSS
ncbi:MAG: GMC family oxidoreductase N-terminal domain-containing protein [Pseudomonadota bacterium]